MTAVADGTRGPALALDAGFVQIRPYEARFERDLIDICWRTGLMGESLEGTGRFEDRRLFAMFFCRHYLRFEPESCFVAVASGGEVPVERAVGYIVGTADTAAQHRDFGRRMVPRIAARLALYDSWRHPESFRQTLAFAAAERSIDRGLAVQLGGPAFPAHLHINLLPEWQGRGQGGRLMDIFLDRLRSLGCPGVFLETTDRNLKALPFYLARGFEVVGEAPVEVWPGLPAKVVAMALRLDSAKRCM